MTAGTMQADKFVGIGRSGIEIQGTGQSMIIMSIGSRASVIVPPKKLPRQICRNEKCGIPHSKRQAGSNIPRSFLSVTLRPTRIGDFFKAFYGEIAIGVGHVVPDARAIKQGR